MSGAPPEVPSLDCDVAIVGCGPVGATLANLLGRDGLRTRVFERDREIYELPRAVHFDHEVMRIFQSLGLRDSDFGQTAPILGYDFLNGDRELLFRFPIRPDAVTHQGWRTDYMFHQPDLERALREKAVARASVELLLEQEVLHLRERVDHVDLEVHDLANGEFRIFRCGFVVGCDGANSFVRRELGLRLDDLEFDEPWLVVDAMVETPPTELGLPAVPTQLCDPARPVTYVPVAGPYIRWEFMLLPGEDRQEMMRPEWVEALIAKWADPTRVRVIRSAVYDFHALVAERWATRRVFLAGDSAHQTPPFLGQGMCAGIRDAANLAWRLVLASRGQASPAIFDSYQSERDPHVRRLIGIAVDMGRIICTRDPEAAAVRDADFLGREKRDLPMPSFPSIGPGLHEEGNLGGQLGLQARVRGAEGTPCLLDDLLGPGFALIARGPEDPKLSQAAAVVRDALGVSLLRVEPDLDIDGAYARWFDRHACDAVLVRPDHIVFGSGQGPAAASRLLVALSERLQPTSFE